MASCPTIPDHRCLDCSPPTRGRPFSSDGLHTGNPLTPLGPNPATQDPAAFDSHWAGVTTTRSSLTFDGVAPNHDHFIVIPSASRKATKAPSGKQAAAKARQALTAQIPVIIST
jgi:hypothetical protein